MKFIIDIDGVKDLEEAKKNIKFTKKSGLKLISISEYQEKVKNPATLIAGKTFKVEIKSAVKGNSTVRIPAIDEKHVHKIFAERGYSGRIAKITEEK